MRFSACSSTGIFVTGAGGFIGAGVCRTLEAEDQVHRIPVDVRDREQMRAACGHLRPTAVIHLASKGSVTSPLNQVGTMMSTAIDGLVNVLSVLKPQNLILASSCAVYGNTGTTPAAPEWRNVNPLSVYGLTKAMAEEVASLWVSETGNAAFVLRLGNVVGDGCGGLISYLVRHAIHHQEPVVPARMRGGGRIVRDYVPLSHVCRALVAAAGCPAPPGTVRTLNVGSGQGMTNRSVSEIVQSVLGSRGYRLEIEWDPDPAHGEGSIALLDVDQTERLFGLRRPNSAEVRRAIEEGVVSCLERYAAVPIEARLPSAAI